MAKVYDTRLLKLVTDVISTCWGEETQVTPETRFIEDLETDDLFMIEMILGLEESFGIDIPDGDQDAWKTVGDVLEYLEKVQTPAPKV